MVDGKSCRATARSIGVAPSTLSRALRRRTADEFKGAKGSGATPPRKSHGSYAWSLEKIRAGRDAQMRGQFREAVRLAEATRTDDAVFVARFNRIAPQSAVEAIIKGHPSSRGAAIAAKMKEGVIVARSTLEGIHGTLADHGIAIGYNTHTTNKSGTAVSIRMKEWPLEHVWWNATREVLQTRTKEGETLDIVHGDGTWVVFAKYELTPWVQEAALLPVSFIWAGHAHGISDWAGASNSHGVAKVMGELPSGITLLDKNGNLTPEAQAFLQMLQDIVSGNAGAGVRPAGAKTDFLSNTSTAWQVFKELVLNRERAAAMVYLGTDASLGATGGAPGVDIATLFGIATTKVQGDLHCIEQALRTGVYEIWTAINFGDSQYCPWLEYQLPDPDKETNSAQAADRLERLLAAIERMRKVGMVLTQTEVNAMAAAFAVDPVPQLAETGTAKVAVELAPTDVARVVKVREARSSQGLPPLGTPDDDLFVGELEAKQAAAAEAAKAGAVATPAPEAAPEAQA